MKSGMLIFPVKWVRRISFAYLLIPFCIFCIGFLQPYVGLPITALLFFVFVYIWRSQNTQDQLRISKSNWIIVLAIILVWVFLSGIGGFAFQNTDFHARNAIFHDLINKPWPVKYNTNPTDPSITYTLTYYIGFWLPAALIGKFAGWQIANIFFYLWSVIGVILGLLLLATKIKLSPVKLTLLLIFFSGMDALGILLEMGGMAANQIYINKLWPPILHLEAWGLYFQYSSFSTQLFWVFNQAIPAWLCMALLITAKDRRNILLIWSLCCFFAPLPALGMFPYVALKIFKQLFNPENLKDKSLDEQKFSVFRRGVNDLFSVLTIENILGGGIVLLISFGYFSANIHSADQTVNNFSFEFWFMYPIFILMEGLCLWFVLKKHNNTNLNWYLAGFLILAIPLIKIGVAQDFCMRASIPTLFMLMVWSADELTEKKSPTRTFLIVLLCIGAITPLYEINRSIYRTTRFYFDPPTAAQAVEGQKIKIYDPKDFVHDHPYSLTADSFKSLANFNPDDISNFLAKTNHSFFETYIEK